MKLQLEVKELAKSYKRKGGRKNRKQQVAKMLSFAKHAESLGANSMGQVGTKHVISYWKSLQSKRNYKKKTLYFYWLAIQDLWQFVEKVGDPPEPHYPEEAPKKKLSKQQALGGTNSDSTECLEAEYQLFLSKVRDIENSGKGAWLAQSPSEQAALALALNRADWLQETSCTLVEAIERTDPARISMLPRIVRALDTKDACNGYK